MKSKAKLQKVKLSKFVNTIGTLYSYSSVTEMEKQKLMDVYDNCVNEAFVELSEEVVDFLKLLIKKEKYF